MHCKRQILDSFYTMKVEEGKYRDIALLAETALG